MHTGKNHKWCQENTFLVWCFFSQKGVSGVTRRYLATPTMKFPRTQFQNTINIVVVALVY